MGFSSAPVRQGVLLSWPVFGALTPTRRVGYQHAK